MVMRRYDDRYKPAGFFSLVLATFFVWFWAVHRLFELPSAIFLAVWRAAKITPDVPAIWVPTALAFSYGLLVLAVIFGYFNSGFEGADFVMYLRGARMVGPARLKDITRQLFYKHLRFAGVPVPESIEALHFSAVGSTGSGKSVVISDYIESALDRKERLICIDPNGQFMEKFYRDGDIIINPFEARTRFWGIFNEIRTPYDVASYSVSLIPKSPSTDQEIWNAMARTISSEVMLKLWRLGLGDTDHLVYWLTIASNDELMEMLADTAARGMFHGAEETIGSVRAVLTRYITPHKYLSDIETAHRYFSIRDWTDSNDEDQPNIWIPWREDQLESLKPLISCMFDVTCNAALSKPTTDDIVATHLVADELDSLEKLNYLVPASTKGRKHRLYICAGMQSYAQLNATNGKDDAMTIRNSLRSTISLGIAEMDTYTAEEISVGLGEHEVLRLRPTSSRGQDSTGQEVTKERIVIPAQIHGLPNLTGFLKLAGNYPVSKITMPYKKRKAVTEPFIMGKNRWTMDAESANEQARIDFSRAKRAATDVDARDAHDSHGPAL